jgi:predicted dehydrogenase
MIRLGFLGCGRHGERYLRHATHDVTTAQPVALWRRDRARAQTLARTYGVRVAASAQELVERDDVDAVVVLTPPALHRDEVLRIARAGKPVLVEKPVTANLAQAQQLMEAAAAVPVMVAQTLRYNPALRAIRGRLGELGPLHRVRMQQRLEPSDLAWQRDAAVAGGGSILLTGVHLFDQLRWQLGRTPDAVSCQALAVAGHPLENVFDACFVYEDEGVLAATEVSKFSASRSSLLEVVGEEGQLWTDYAAGRLWRRRGREVEELPAPGDVPTVPALLEDFVRVAEGDLPSPIPLEEGRQTLIMAEACYLAHRRGRTVRCDEVTAESHSGPACERGLP